MPAQAGIQVQIRFLDKRLIPACAVMTKEKVDFESTGLEVLGLKPKII